MRYENKRHPKSTRVRASITYDVRVKHAGGGWAGNTDTENGPDPRFDLSLSTYLKVFFAGFNYFSIQYIATLDAHTVCTFVLGCGFMFADRLSKKSEG